MTKFIQLLCIVLQLFYQFDNGFSFVQKINPFKKVFKTLLQEPPVLGDNSTKYYEEMVKEKWLEQKLDHFDEHNNKTWMMRYFVNNHFYQPGGPIFLFVGGEWEISSQMLQRGHFYDMAKQHEGIMFYTEHRYYGKSWPKSNLSSDNLKFLNVLQSLEDLKCFIDYQKSREFVLHDANVVLVGGSYSGSMAAWFMKLYPKTAAAAWSTSAPLKAKMDFYEYMHLTMSSIEQKGGLRCAQNLHQAFEGLLKLLQSRRSYQLLKRLNICNNFDATNPMDSQAFFNGLGNYFAALVQSYRSMIPQFCLNFLTMDANPTEALIKFLAQIFSPQNEIKKIEEEQWCLDFSYQGMKAVFTDVNDLQTGTRPWFYQTCHEFGWFSTTSTTQSSTFSTSPLPFGGQIPLTYFQQLCQDVFGADVNVGHGKALLKAATQPPTPPLTLQQMHNSALTINQIFGGLSDVSKHVIFTHGLLDPWRAVGLQYGQNVLLLKDYSHVEDLGSINLSDSVEMNVAKLKVAAFINHALKENQQHSVMNKLVKK